MGLNSPVYRGVAVEDRPQQPGRAGQTKKEREKSGKTRLVKAKNANETDDLYSIYDRATKKYGHGTWPFISAH